MIDLSEKSRDSLKQIEKRKFPRYDYCSRIQYVLDNEPEHKVSTGVTRNISAGGLCLFIFEPLGEGQALRILSELPVGSQITVLRWIRKADDLYEAGLMFIDNDSGTLQ